MTVFVTPPPLTEEEVSAAEQELEVTFPAEYRHYVLHVSSGGRLARLEKTEDGWWWSGNNKCRRARLTTQFPHPDSYVEADQALDAREPKATDFSDEVSFMTAWQAWDAECELAEDGKTAGAIEIEDNGCGFATLLAITGPLAGTVWWDGRATCDQIVPLSVDHAAGARPATLDEWLLYGSWNLLPSGWGPARGGFPLRRP
jgi:hypothetical protein